MDEAERARFECLFKLYEMPWKRISERRTYEVKISMALWTLQVGVIVFVLSNPTAFSADWKKPVLGLGVTFAALIGHIVWICGVANGHNTDRSIALGIEQELKKLATIQTSDKEERERKQALTASGETFNWARGPMLGVTIVLGILLVITCTS